MPSAPWTKFYNFIQDQGRGVNNLNSDTLAIYLSDTAPNQSTAKVKADVPEIATGHGYAGPIPIHNAFAQSLGIGTLTGDAAETITASGGSVGPFRYVILCNTTQPGSPLIAFCDYGSEVTLLAGATFTVTLPPAIVQLS